MSSRIVKLACAAALAMPLVGAVGATTAHAADDCRQPYGAIQGGSSDDATCDRVGLHLRNAREHRHDHDGNHANRTQTRQATVAATPAALLCPGNSTLQFVSVDSTGNGTVDFIVPAGQLNNASAIPNGTNPVGVAIANGQQLGGGNPLLATGDVVTITCA